MRTDRRGYLMAMMAGLAIVGASTGAALTARSHQANTQAAAANVAAVPVPTARLGVTVGRLSATAATTPSDSPMPSATAAGSATAVSAVPSTAAGTPQRPSSTGARSSRPTTTAPTSPARTTSAVRTTSAAPTTSAARTTSPARTSTSTSAPAQQFRDGRYSATGSYDSPGGPEEIGVTVNLSADKIISSELELLGGAGISHSFQTAFASGYADQVIGKKIDSVSLGTVSGSSLTSLGFNSAIEQIEAKARIPK